MKSAILKIEPPLERQEDLLFNETKKTVFVYFFTQPKWPTRNMANWGDFSSSLTDKFLIVKSILHLFHPDFIS